MSRQAGESRSAAKAARAQVPEGRRCYRYRITESWGSMVDRCEIGGHVVDWTYFGRGHTWGIFNTKTLEPTGSMTGVYVDKGYIVDGKFVTDAEMSA